MAMNLPEPACQWRLAARDLGLMPWRSHGNALQCSCLETPKDRGVWQAQSIGSHRIRHDKSDLAHTSSINGNSIAINIVINTTKEMATHSSILAWKILWTEEPGKLQSMVLQRVGHDWATSRSLSIEIYAHCFPSDLESCCLLMVYFISQSPFLILFPYYIYIYIYNIYILLYLFMLFLSHLSLQFQSLQLNLWPPGRLGSY